MEVSRQLHVPVALSRENNPHYTLRQVKPIAGLHAVVNRNPPCSLRESNHDSSVFHPVA
jgi:hypothetical protein